MKAEAEREVTLTLKVKTFGTEAQAERTAERIKQMLEVELHAPVRLSEVQFRVIKPRKRKVSP